MPPATAGKMPAATKMRASLNLRKTKSELTDPARLQISGLAGFQANITRAKAATRLGSTGFANLPPRLTDVPTITPSAVRR